MLEEYLDEEEEALLKSLRLVALQEGLQAHLLMVQGREVVCLEHC